MLHLLLHLPLLLPHHLLLNQRLLPGLNQFQHVPNNRLLTHKYRLTLKYRQTLKYR
jgi:hypothetical protein